MQEKVCDLWIEPADYRCIPTSGAVASDGTAVMDSGIALQAKQRYADLEVDLGRLLTARGNHVHELRPGLLSFPVKQYEWSGVVIDIVRRSANELQALVGDAKTLLPRPELKDEDVTWEALAEALSSLPDNIVVVQHR
jgi:hypothetical protein